MKRSPTPNQTAPLILPYLCLVIILLFGIVFRFAYLGSKIYWVDEVATSIRVSGYTVSEVIAQVSAQGVVSVKDLQRFVHLSPEKNWADTFNALRQSPEHAPLYFLMVRWWVQRFGDSLTAIRSFSAVVSLLAFPCLYELGRELFKSPWGGWVALTLMSVSPFYVAYAQEARPYSLWTVTILLSSVALLRAVRLNNRLSWFLYTVTLVLSLYTSLLSFLVVISQSVYAIASTKKTILVNYFIATSVAIAAFLPWLLVIFSHWQAFQTNTTWMRVSLEFPAMVAIWISSILLIFGDLPVSNSLNLIKVVEILIALVVFNGVAFLIYCWVAPRKRTRLFLITLLIITPLILIICLLVVFAHLPIATVLEPLTIVGVLSALYLLVLVTYSSVFLRCSPQIVRLFIPSLAVVTPAVLIGLDLILNGQCSATPRYLIPFQLGIQLSVAHLFASKIMSTSSRQHSLWKLIFIALISFGLFSCIINLEKSPRYQKSRSIHNIPIAAILNKSERLLVAEPNQIPDLLSLSYSLNQNTRIKILPEPNIFESNQCSVFLFNPSKSLQSQIKAEFELEQVYYPQLTTPDELYLSLWQVSKSCVVE